MAVSASRHHHASAYQKAKEGAKARSAAITLAGQDIAPMPSPKDPGRRYKSLSAVAKAITGAHWSGPQFFGLRTARKDSDQ